MNRIAVVAAGQGAQKPRMLTGWLKLPGVREAVTSWSEQADVDLIELGTKADADTLAATENAQPILVCLGVLISDMLADKDLVLAGHSVGELTAACLAGVVDPGTAVTLARRRGLAMARACAAEPTTMAAVIGGNPDDVVSRLTDLGLSAANINGAGQIVAAGPVDAVAKLVAEPPAGTAVKQLHVAGAFHTAYMEPAQEAFAQAAHEITFSDPKYPIISNLDGQEVRSGDELRDRLIAQVTAPVRWDLCLKQLAARQPDLAISAPPGKVQASLLSRQIPSLRTLCVTTPRDATQAAAQLEELSPVLQEA
ncbi:ACP S-malonyltransferase [Cutibacterium sp. WCA-380-WT-3A]|uniref:[acyl-carrier-protein] S-malonyltransferase n=1 Tax=Cutibacterium porci TaxID=2605781 RepID=A0A7K0J3V0_9ACTN|nr:ACP S-malonyltransferase [Cutibacterium porci]MSS44606.1 ACP S-malonyltransferase [Cutibacterium porci]